MSVSEQRIGTTTERANQLALRCATCEVVITSHPECHDGETFCCAGCVAGGPCICIGGATAESIAARAGRSVADARLGDVLSLETLGRRRWAVVLRAA
jgi:hypothetical protein